MLKRVYVWRGPVRITHWLNAFCILVLSITGLYIANPYMHVDDASLIMARMRYVHFLSAYMFTASLIVRIYWLIKDKKYGKFDQFIPLTSDRWKSFVESALFYTYLKKHPSKTPGHNSLAGFVYLIMFVLFVIETMTGFGLYSISNTGALFQFMGGWVLNFLNLMTIRLVHHLIMWIIFSFVVVHVYLVIFNDWVEKDELLMSILTGYKIIDE